MRIASLVLVFGVGAACGGGSRPAPARVSSDASSTSTPTVAPAVAVRGVPLCKPPAAGTAALMLPAIEASRDLKLDVHRPGGVEPEDWKGKMTVDGVVTSSIWPMHAPVVHRLPDGRSVLDDRYNANLISIWDPATKTLTELARGVLFPVRGRGMLVYTGDGANTDVDVFSDIDPDAPRLREQWRFERSKSDTYVAGVIDGMPALMVRPATGAVPKEARSTVTLLCLTGAGVSSRFDVVVPAGFSAAGVDPIDGHRMLLIGDIADFDSLYTGGYGKPFDAEVAILDLVTGKHRSIGRAAGSWTQHTAVPHPVLEVAWSDGIVVDRHRFRLADDNAVTWVDPTTETLGVDMP